jgi:8-oxo-dGTP diphosphatase
MKLIYGTTNKAKVESMRRRIEGLGVEMLCLNDVYAPKLDIKEDGSNPLENAKIKALAYYNVLKQPLFSCDSGLYIDGLDEARQPGQNVRGADDSMTDDEAVAYYSALAEEFGGKLVARYKNAVVLVLDENRVYEYMGDDIFSEPFYIVSKPHSIRNEGFPLDSLSVHIESGEYYYDMGEKGEKTGIDGFREFFRRVLEL